MQKVLIMSTQTSDLRSEAIGWSAEDSNLVRPGPIGNSPGFPGPYSYPTPVHALADGWRLLAPPTQFDVKSGNGTVRREWEWWFTKD